MRRLWTEETVDHDGAALPLRGRVDRPPARAAAARRVARRARARSSCAGSGRLADGWLPSFCTPEQVGAGPGAWSTTAAAAAGRTIDPEHFGAMVFYTRGPLPEAYVRALAERRGVDAADVIVTGLDALRDRLEEFVAVGFSKLVPVPMHEVESWDDELDYLADAVLDLQT